MKRLFIFCALLPATTFAQQYSIDSYKTSGGGGTSSNANYSVAGTIGQPDAGGTMTGGNYSLTSGFWALISVAQTAGAPALSITHSGNEILVSWPLATGFVLQQNSDLSTTNWTSSSYTIATNAEVESITIPSLNGTLFFRLKQQ